MVASEEFVQKAWESPGDGGEVDIHGLKPKRRAAAKKTAVKKTTARKAPAKKTTKKTATGKATCLMPRSTCAGGRRCTRRALAELESWGLLPGDAP
jgi:DNA end-binding protein Ku